MSTAPLANSFEGGTNGVAITAGNSGGASGNAFDTVTGTLAAFSSTQAAHGALSMAVPLGVSLSANHCAWAGLGLAAGTDVFTRLYLFVPANPTTSMGFLRYRTAAAADSFIVKIDTAGKLAVTDAAAALVPALAGTVAVPLAAWFRIEVRGVSDTAAGQVEWRLFSSPDSNTVTETLSATGLTLGAGTDRIAAGVISGGKASSTFYFDDVSVWPAVNPGQASAHHYYYA